MNRRSSTAIVASVALTALVWGGFAPPAAGAEPAAIAPAATVETAVTPAAVGSSTTEVVRTDQWMKQLWTEAPTALDVPLWKFIFPGSHDAGTYGIKPVLACEGCDTHLAPMDASCRDTVPDALHFLCDEWSGTIASVSLPWARTQSRDLQGQLNAGSRFFDLRFFRATADDQERTKNDPELRLTEGNFYIHHTLAGPQVEEIMNSIVAFLSAPGHERELIILRLDHLKEGDGAMGVDSINALLTYIESRIGEYLAPRSLGADATPTELLDKGHQVILAYDYSPPVDADGNPAKDDAGNLIPTVDQAHLDNLWTINNNYIERLDDPATTDDVEGGYPLPDDPERPWRNVSEIVTTASTTFAKRADLNGLSSAGLAIGLDDGVFALIRQAICPDYDPLSKYPGPDGRLLCPALDDDYDEFGGLMDVSAYTNPMILPSLTQIPRRYVNMVHVDFYPGAFTQEAYTLNRGAMRTAVRIFDVSELTSHDSGLEVDINTHDPDFYPVFTFPDVPPTAWASRDERNQRRTDAAVIHPWWPGWRAYPNDWGTANVKFGIRDADVFSDDDDSRINGSSITQTVSIDVSGCFADVDKCPQNADPGLHQISGTGDSDTSRVTYSVDACVWSFIAGHVPAERSVCDLSSDNRPNVSIVNAQGDDIPDVEKLEGTGAGFTPFEFRVKLDKIVPRDTSIRYVVEGGTAARARIMPCTAPACDFPGSGSSYVTIPAGLTSALITVDVLADSWVEDTEDFTVQIFDGWPAMQLLKIVDGTATGRIANDDAYSVSIDDAGEIEGSFVLGQLCEAGPFPMVFTATLNQPRSQTVTVDWAAVQGTAQPDTDLIGPVSGTLTFAPGVVTQKISITSRCDLTFEPDETFIVQLSHATGDTLITPGGGEGTIKNDDEGTSITIAPREVGFSEGDSGTRGFEFKIGTSTFDHKPVTVYYETVSGTAGAPDDYTAVTSSVTFQHGDTVKPVTIYANGDTAVEPDETFFIRLLRFETEDEADAGGFVIDPNQDESVATIRNDDGGKLSISDVTAAEGTQCTTTPFVFTVSASKPSASPVTVRYDTKSGAAIAGSDYTPASGEVTFAPGEVSKTITVPVTCDSDIEPDEVFIVVLSSPTEASLGDKSTGVGWITNDDEPPAPTVTPVVTGTKGLADWYVTDVGIHFDVQTFGAATTASSGCSDASVVADTAGATFTCTVTTDGGTASASVTVKRDATAPTGVGVLSGPVGDNDWYTGPVKVDWTLDDNMSGVASDCASATSAVEGTNLSFTCTVTDAAGNEASLTSPTYKLDSTPPTAVAALSGQLGDNDWYTGPVTATWTLDDTLSGVATECPAETSGAEGVDLEFGCTVMDMAGNETSETSALYKLDSTPPTAVGVLSGQMGDNDWYTGPVTVTWTLGDTLSGLASDCPAGTSGVEGVDLSFDCTVTDLAGNAASATSPVYKLDSTVPTVTFTGSTGPFSLLDTVAITCTTADSLSGIASDTCKGFAGPAYAFLGGRSYTATATDNAGNVGAGSVRFTVNATADDLCELVKRWVASAGIANSLCVKLAASDRAFNRGSPTAGNNNLDAFIQEVKAQMAKEIAPGHAQTLAEIAAAMKQTPPARGLSE
ncbi:Calx-beta domain-containing protein [Microbacterium sp. SS28]|uniref:Calx-beta domain-containing protein n=1 Tax=Microbacterium sp. SS28 TaxID=2919948 RepID=UPI001FA9D137|nr:Calx-beta domain-containing protein [Microbacterium sp. SS28]